MEGWVSIHRKITQNQLWLIEPFDKARAWIDLIILTNHKDNYIMVRGIRIDIKRSQVGWSEPKLAERWKWSRTKVRNFLKFLEIEQQITIKKNNVTQVITIVNYDQYQQNSTAKRQIKGQQSGTQKSPNNNDDNDNNGEKRKSEGKKFLSPPIQTKKILEERKRDFRAKIFSSDLITKYNEDMLKAFFEYWSEHNEGGRKMKWELKQAFDINKRLTTWGKNESRFNSSTKKTANYRRNDLPDYSEIKTLYEQFGYEKD